MLRKDGTVWLNMGFSHDGHGNLIDQSTMLRDVLIKDGWYCKCPIVWWKPNLMPGSQTKRPTIAHEMIWLMAKDSGTGYYYDAEAVRERQEEYERNRRLREKNQGLDTVYNIASDEKTGQSPQGKDGAIRSAKARQDLAILGTRNLRSVWNIPTQGFPGELCKICKIYYPRGWKGLDFHIDEEGKKHGICPKCGKVARCISAGTSRAACPECGAPWIRVLMPSDRYQKILGESYHGHDADLEKGMKSVRGSNKQNKMRDAGISGKESVTLGWRPGCYCNSGEWPKMPKIIDLENPNPEEKLEVKEALAERAKLLEIYKEIKSNPCVVLDPFLGSGTVGKVAQDLGRDWIGIELNPDYCLMAKERTVSQIGLRL